MVRRVCYTVQSKGMATYSMYRRVLYDNPNHTKIVCAYPMCIIMANLNEFVFLRTNRMLLR